MLSGTIDKQFIDLTELAFAWHRQFTAAVGSAEISVGEQFQSVFIDQPWNALRLQQPDLESRFNPIIQAMTVDLQKHRNIKLMAGRQHGDFHASNIMLDQQRIRGVIDWENYSADLPPGFDIFHFVTTYIEGLLEFAADRLDMNLLGFLSQEQPWINLITQRVVQLGQHYGLQPPQVPLLWPLYFLHFFFSASQLRKRGADKSQRFETFLRLRPTRPDRVIRILSLMAYGAALGKAKSQNNPALMQQCQTQIEKLRTLLQ